MSRSLIELRLDFFTSIPLLFRSDNDQAYGHEQWKNRVGQNGYWCERLICAIASLTNLSSLQFQYVATCQSIASRSSIRLRFDHIFCFVWVLGQFGQYSFECPLMLKY